MATDQPPSSIDFVFIYDVSDGWVPVSPKARNNNFYIKQGDDDDYQKLVSPQLSSAIVRIRDNEAMCELASQSNIKADLAISLGDRRSLTGKQLKCLTALAPLALDLQSPRRADVQTILRKVPSVEYVAVEYARDLVAASGDVKHIGLSILLPTDGGVIARFNQLKSLSARKSAISSDAIAEHLAPLPLTVLKLGDPSLSNYSVIAQLINLEILELRDSNLSDKDLAAFSKLSRLTELSLPFSHLTDKANFSQLPTLKRLDLGFSEIGDQAFQTLQNQTQLEILEVPSTSLKDCSQTFETLEALQDVNLSQTSIGDDVVRVLSDAPKLKKLWLGWTNITEKSLEHLSQSKSLTHLLLHELSLNEDAVAKLKAARPDLKIYR